MNDVPANCSGATMVHGSAIVQEKEMKDSTYVCAICNTVNSNNRLHCQTCGTVPAKYSIRHRASKDLGFLSPETVIARGAYRATMRSKPTRQFRIGTVPLTYYASEND